MNLEFSQQKLTFKAIQESIISGSGVGWIKQTKPNQLMIDSENTFTLESISLYIVDVKDKW